MVKFQSSGSGSHLTLYQIIRRKPPLPMRVVTVASAVVSLGLVAWSVAQYGI